MMVEIDSLWTGFWAAGLAWVGGFGAGLVVAFIRRLRDVV